MVALEASPQNSILYPFQTLASHTHLSPVAITPLSNAVYSPSKYTYTKFALPNLKQRGNGPDFGRQTNLLNDAVGELPTITMLKVVEKTINQETVYCAVGNTIIISKGTSIIRKIVVRENIISFCWIGSLLCVLGGRFLTVIDENELKNTHQQKVKKEPTDETKIESEDMSDTEMSESSEDGDSESEKEEADAIKKNNDFMKLLSDEPYFTPYRSRVELPQDTTPTNVYHLSTYLNKVLITSEEGHIDLLNIVHGNLVYRYGPFQRSEADDIDRNLYIMKERKRANKTVFATITHLEPAPDMLDVVAIGLSDGKILLHDIYTDETLETYRHGTSPIRAISFRTDGESTMVTGSTNGTVAAWNLLTGKLEATFNTVHTASIISLNFIRGTPLLLSSAADNSIKLWEFIKNDRIELKYSAEGHAKPPVKVRFYGPSNSWILSAGPDRQLRLTNIQQGNSRTFVHKEVNSITHSTTGKKNKFIIEDPTLGQRPPIIDFDFSFMREQDWPNLVTAHKKETSISAWSVRDAAMSDFLFKSRKTSGEASCVAISPCGNSAIIGRKNGYIERWNLQSGRFKMRYGIPKKTSENTKPMHIFTNPSHRLGVTGVLVDNLNQYIISVGFDGYLRVWNIKVANEIVKEINFRMPIAKIFKAKTSNMIALAFSDFSISLLDGESFRVMRNFKGHRFIVNDITFSADSRYLYSCANDGYIIVWDIISGDKVDWIEISLPATSIDIDSKDMYIVTSHTNSVGLSVWINKLTFGVGSLKHAVSPTKVNLPLMGDSFHNFTNESDILKPEEEKGRINGKKFKAILKDYHQKVQKDLIMQLGGESEQKLLAIRKLEILRERAKLYNGSDKEALRENMPFFIETNADNFFETKFVVDDALLKHESKTEEPEVILDQIQPLPNEIVEAENTTTEEGNTSKIGSTLSTPPSSRLLQLILESDKMKDTSKVVQYLLQASPKIIDMSIRLLSSYDNYFEMIQFLKFLIRCLRSNTLFDLCQSMLNLFLQAHDEIIIVGAGHEELFYLLEYLEYLQTETWSKLDEKITNNVFLCKHLSNLQ